MKFQKRNLLFLLIVPQLVLPMNFKCIKWAQKKLVPVMQEGWHAISTDAYRVKDAALEKFAQYQNSQAFQAVGSSVDSFIKNNKKTSFGIGFGIASLATAAALAYDKHQKNSYNTSYAMSQLEQLSNASKSDLQDLSVNERFYPERRFQNLLTLINKNSFESVNDKTKNILNNIKQAYQAKEMDLVLQNIKELQSELSLQQAKMASWMPAIAGVCGLALLTRIATY